MSGEGVFCPIEIEFDVNLGAGRDEILFRDTDGTDDQIVIGQLGVDRNPSGGCDDLEVEAVGDEYIVDSGAGTDTISASGGRRRDPKPKSC